MWLILHIIIWIWSKYTNPKGKVNTIKVLHKKWYEYLEIQDL